MAIPDFDPIFNLLPPHLGDPTDISQLSPYPANLLEVAQKLGASIERGRILRGLIQLRDLLRREDLQGFQWLAGSFLENIEKIEDRHPRDIDVVTFFQGRNINALRDLATRHPILTDEYSLRERYKVDHYFVDASLDPLLIVEQARYWTNLFSHTRGSASSRYGMWKGMVRVELTQDASEDARALEWLQRGGLS
jgi:hypothetical protein